MRLENVSRSTRFSSTVHSPSSSTLVHYFSLIHPCITTIMAFPGGHAGLPGVAGQQQDAGMSEQEAKMVKMVRLDPARHRVIANGTHRCNREWNHVSSSR